MSLSTRARLLIPLAVLAVLATSVVVTQPAQQAVAGAIAKTQHDRLKVWSINIRHLNDDWWRVLEVMEDDYFKPDMILVQEISGTEMDNKFLDGVRKRFATNGDSYYYRQAFGGNAVIWRSPRLKINSSKTSTNPADNEIQWLRWSKDTDEDTTCGPDADGKKEIGVRLWDTEQERIVVASSVHWSPHHGSASACMEKNLRRLDYKLETGPDGSDPWGLRNMTVVGGDFNQHPDKEADTQFPDDEYDTGSQLTPECWYTTFSATHDLDYEVGCEQEDRVDTYYDTVWERQRGRVNENSGDPEICHQWTRRKKDATIGTACTDRDGNYLRDGSRIDYIWVRWEYAGGGAKPFTMAEASDMIPRARRDKSCVDSDCESRYSDHRAVTAVVRWCPTTNSC